MIVKQPITNELNKDLFIKFIRGMIGRQHPYTYIGGMVQTIDGQSAYDPPRFQYILKHMHRTTTYIIDFEFNRCDLTLIRYSLPELILDGVTIEELLDYLEQSVLVPYLN